MNRLIILLVAVMVMAFAVPASATLNGWEAAAAADSPGFVATNVPLGVYDIGTYGGEQTYEFIVNCNPDEEAVSLALIGRYFDDGISNRAAIKYEQWNNTGTYGATIFGVVDLDFGVAINRGVDTHLVFVASEAAGTTELYVDGVLAGSVDGAISLSGAVGIGGANRDLEGEGWVDPFDGDILGVAIYDGALSADQIAAHIDAYNAFLSVVRSNGADGDRDPIGAYDGSTPPLPTEEGGLKDGNLVFSDRTYPLTGIPAEYEGIDYIRTFNSDKGHDVTYELSINQYALVWVTVDDRHDPMQANVDSLTATIAQAGTFVDTGLDVYVREKDDGSRDRPLSVFAAELPAGTYNFGRTNGNNNYILGALPAEEPVVVPSDVTAPGDAVKGVPNDGLMDGTNWGWPGGEYPGLAIDDNTGTKYLHFRGDFDAGDPLNGSGIQITPAAGASIVTGLTFTTANDSPNRDPAAFALYGSNAGIDGPYELIACGDISDFDQADEWPRFTINETMIAFDNYVVYEHYQLQFTDIRDISTANSMQVAEIELIGLKLNATNISPADGEGSVGIDDDLSWTVGSFAASHDVYIGTEIPPAFAANVQVDPLFMRNSTSFDPGTLEYGTTYYVQIDAVEEDGTVRTGAVTSFTTTTPVGIFEYTQDIGGPAGLGRTTYEGYVWENDTLSEQYRIMGGGGDIAGSNDQFHFAYNRVSGDVRISASFEWVVASNEWAKMGVMLRAGNAGDDISHSMVTRRDENLVHPQHRNSKGGNNGGPTPGSDAPVRLGIQRVTVDGLTWIQSLADFGDGWEGIDAVLAENLPDEMLVGICVTSHDNSHLVQVRATNVTYELNPSLVGDLGIATVPADADLGAPTSDVSGFSIRSLKPLISDGWGYDAMNELLDTGTWMGLPAQPGTEGTRIDEFVNLRDTGNGAFSEANGYPDKSYPGIDPLEDPAQDPAAGDDDNDFATEILGSIQLTAGVHYIGANSDDGTIIEIGGVEVARTGEWKGASNEDFLYLVEADGWYSLRARTLEGGGGASIELHEIFMDGTRILLNDVANGGSAVFAPAP